MRRRKFLLWKQTYLAQHYMHKQQGEKWLTLQRIEEWIDSNIDELYANATNDGNDYLSDDFIGTPFRAMEKLKTQVLDRQLTTKKEKETLQENLAKRKLKDKLMRHAENLIK